MTFFNILIILLVLLLWELLICMIHMSVLLVYLLSFEQNTMKIVVPIEIIELETQSFHLLVSCQISNDLSGDLVIDTGASKTVLDRNFVTNYELVENEDSAIQSKGLGEGSINTEMAKIDSFQLGELFVLGFDCALIDLSGINEMYQQHCQRKICGLLGSDFLLKHRAIIDYEKKELQLDIV